MLNAYIYDGLRTPFGRHAGSLAKIRPDDLAAHVIKALVQKHNLPADIFNDVILKIPTRPVKTAVTSHVMLRYWQVWM
jgi:acetyl-CoA acetyltransferase